MTERSDLIQRYEEIFQSNGILLGITAGTNTKIVKIIETVPNLLGEHLGSVCRYQTVEFVNGRKLELFVKQLPENSVHLENLKKFNVFARESNFFNILLPDLQKVWLTKSETQEPLDFFPKCFYADDKEIILENLIKSKGYHLNSKLERQNLEYATLSVQNLAALHGVGYVLLNEVGENAAFIKYPCLEEALFSNANPLFLDMIQNGKTIAVEMLNNFKVNGSNDALKTLEKYGKNISKDLIYLIGPNSKHLIRTIAHGDYWNNNMLFLNEPTTGKLKHQILFDFQCTRIGSPNLDLGYFFFTSVKPEIRRKHWKQLLEIYFNAFKTTLKKLRSEFPIEITFEDFVVDFKAKSLLGFWMGIFISTALEVLSTMDPSKIECDFSEHIRTEITKWIKNNPEKTKEKVKEIVDLCEEYENIMS